MQPKWILMKLILPFAENSIRPLSDTLLLLVIEYLVYAYVYLCILLLLLILLLILIMIHCSVLLNHRQILNTFSLVILKLKLTNFINILYKLFSNIIWIRLKKYIFLISILKDSSIRFFTIESSNEIPNVSFHVTNEKGKQSTRM